MKKPTYKDLLKRVRQTMPALSYREQQKVASKMLKDMQNAKEAYPEEKQEVEEKKEEKATLSSFDLKVIENLKRAIKNKAPLTGNEVRVMLLSCGGASFSAIEGEVQGRNVLVSIKTRDGLDTGIKFKIIKK